MLTKYDVYIALMYFVWKTLGMYLQQEKNPSSNNWCDDLLEEEVETIPTSTELICYMST
jgi:hypothetical protein